MRLFVALPLDEAVREGLASATAPWRAGERPDAEGWRWARPDGWHITLAFLGQVEEERVAEVGPVVGERVVATGPVALELGELGRFGRRVLHVRVADDPPGAVAELGAAVQEGLAAADLPVQQREVRPHLTLARARRRARPLMPDLVVPSGAWEAREACVYVSHRHPDGARYEVLERLPLLPPRPGTAR